MMGGKSGIVLLGLVAWLCVGVMWVETIEEESVGKEVDRTERGEARSVLLGKNPGLITEHG